MQLCSSPCEDEEGEMLLLGLATGCSFLAVAGREDHEVAVRLHNLCRLGGEVGLAFGGV